MEPTTHENTVIVFHSYPKKPCLDGLMSAVLTFRLPRYSSTNISYVPYWRNQFCFEQIKKTMEWVGLRNTQLVYVDCSPEVKEEVEYLKNKVLQFVPVTVYDHHPEAETSPMHELKNIKNFTFKFDENVCVAKMMYDFFSKEEKKNFAIEDLMTLIQFSEYEGMDPTMAGEEEATKIADKTLCKAFAVEESAQKNLKKIIDMKLGLYYILDDIDPKENDWEFLYNVGLSAEDVYNKFTEQVKIYLKSCASILNGKDSVKYGTEKTNEYIIKMEETLPKKLSNGSIIKNPGIDGSIFIANVSIFEIGRGIEPIIRKEMERREASYAVLMNSPNEKDGQKSYYFSLRRVNNQYDARDLVNFIKVYTGTKIGGGHPWASGVVLDEQQRKSFLSMIQ